MGGSNSMSAIAGRVLLIPRGNYDATATYTMLDMVVYNGSSYICKQTSTGNLPTDTTYWMLNASGSAVAYLNDIGDVVITNVSNGQVLMYDSTTQKWVNGTLTLNGLNDTQFASLTNGQVLKYNATSQKWENADESGGLLPHLIIISETGSTVTATKGQTVITATETSAGHFECDVPEFGTWTIDAILGGDDAQISLVVDTVKVYTVDDTHFHADITVTYPTGATVSCSKTGETTMYATGSPYTFTVHTAGTWTLTCTKDGETWTKTVNVTTSGQTFNILLTPDGTTATANDVELWLYCAGIFDSTDETLADVLADTSTLIELMNNENAVDYLVRSTDWVSTICASSDGMSAIGSSDDASESLIADSTWGTAIWNSTYVENVMNVHVPAMVTNILPNGVASDYRQLATAYIGFDGNTTTDYSSGTGRTTSDFLQYDFIAPVVVNKVVVRRYNSTDLSKILIKGSNDGKTFTSLTEQITIGTDVQTIDLSNTTPYRFYRLQADDTDGNHWFRINELQFLGRNKGGVQTWLRKAGITNKNYVTLDELLADTTTVNTLLADTDAVDYLVTCNIFAKNICASSMALALVGLHNYCSNTLISDEDWAIAIANSDYAEEVFNIHVPTMSNNTTPSGECSAYKQNADAYKAFDKLQSTCYSSGGGQVAGDYLQYQFPNAKDIKIAKVFRHGDSDLKQFVIQGSNDGTNWTNISALVTLNDYNVADKVKIVPLITNIAYSYYRIQNMYTASTSNYFAIDEAQFYGREDV